jgi:hypothetical protein
MAAPCSWLYTFLSLYFTGIIPTNAVIATYLFQNSARFKSLGSGIGVVAANFSRHGKFLPLVTVFLKKNGKSFQY